MTSSPKYTWDLVIARIKARRDARAESGVDVANLDSIIGKMERRDKRWEDGEFYNSHGAPAISDREDAMSSLLSLVVKLEKLHTRHPSLKARMLADEAARLAERVNAFVEGGSQ